MRYFVASMGMMVISCFIASYDPLERLIESVSSPARCFLKIIASSLNCLALTPVLKALNLFARF